MNAPLKFSLIVPVFNRPEEVRELLQSLTAQTYTEFEVIIAEDGSQQTCENEVALFRDKLDIKYFYKPNEGPGLTRNFGANKASGNYFIFFDSDCLIPDAYMQTVKNALETELLDVFGGPDAAHPSFSPIQKAISYSMTSFFTTGGIRGGDKKVDVFHPRSFNMGLSKEVFEKTGGFAKMRFGEDLDMSMRIIEAGYKAGLIREAFVYHKRRTDFRKFFRQIHNSGIARINLYKRHPQTLKIVHFVPAVFVVFLAFSLLLLLFGYLTGIFIILAYFTVILIDSWQLNNDLEIGLLSVQSSFVQHLAYGTGFIKAFWQRIILGKPEFHAYEKNFYK
ncbi:MAG: glycosyltransferase [Sphingobacteriales bacterium]|nr:MAG: glycosyltransferase [Sphingobacteriales bacterium]